MIKWVLHFERLCKVDCGLPLASKEELQTLFMQYLVMENLM